MGSKNAFEFCNYRLKFNNNGLIQLAYYANPVRVRRKPIKIIEVPEVGPPDEDGWCYLGKSFDELFDDVVEVDSDEFLECEISEKNKEIYARRSLTRTKEKIYELGYANDWEWFVTFTFARNEFFDATDLQACKKKLSKWMENMKQRKCPDLKYVSVYEKHHIDGYHFHCLVSGIDDEYFEIAYNNQEYLKNDDGSIKKNKKGQPIPNKYFGDKLRISYPDGDYLYNIKSYHLGFTAARKISGKIDSIKAVNYLTKYITKDLCIDEPGKKRYLCSLNLPRPRTLYFNRSVFSLVSILSDIQDMYKTKLQLQHEKVVNIKTDEYWNSITYWTFYPEEST